MKSFFLFILCICVTGLTLSLLERNTELEARMAHNRKSIRLESHVQALIDAGNATEHLMDLIHDVSALDLVDYDNGPYIPSRLRSSCCPPATTHP